jgi:4-amino-4-deoxy-L-arabinose transferase-like glycosyltransferase
LTQRRDSARVTPASDTRTADSRADRIAIGILAAVAVIAAATFRDYGLGWDDYTHSQYGELLLRLYGSGFADTRALSFVNLYKYGGGFDMAAALAAKVLPLDLFETRRLAGAAVGLVGLAATWRLGRRLGGPVAGVAALALLATCPLYVGHMFINPKDAPFAAAMAALTLAAVRAFDEYPQPQVRTAVLFGIALGAAFGSRVLAGIAAPEIGAGLALLVYADMRARGLRAAARHLLGWLRALAPSLALGYLIMGLLWPWSVLAPLNPLRAAEYFDTFFEKPWQELYEGRPIAVPKMPASYLPHLFALKLPDVMLWLGILGGIGVAVGLFLDRQTRPAWRAGLLTLWLAAFLPIGVAMITRPALYNGLRHFIFVLPPFAVLGGLAAARLFAAARARGRPATVAIGALGLLGVAAPAAGMARLHPYEYTYFNLLSGGVTKAEDEYMLDYWGLAFKQAADALHEWLAARHLSPPAGRRWVVAVCGPQAVAQVELGPAFETVFNQKRADFALMLGTFYCRHLRAPVIVDIMREGVSYARVYDLRGRPTPELLTQPPP